MRKLIIMSMLALISMTSFAGNLDKCVSLSSCEDQIRGYFEIVVDEWYFPGGGVFPTTFNNIYSEKGWFTSAELEARKSAIKLLYPDNLSGGVGSKYIVLHRMATPLIPAN